MDSLVADFASGLLTRQGPPCLSIHQPTHRHHPDNQQDPIRFRNLVRRLEESLVRVYHAGDARALLEPFRALAEDADFWNHTQQGLSVLGAPGFFRVYRLLRSVPERVVAADSFHLKPLMRIIQSAEGYHVLALNRREIRLFEGNRDALDEIALVPGARTITEAVGDRSDEPQRDVADLDTERFFRAVDRSVLEHYSRPSGLPLILAALTEHHQPFRRVSQNPFLVAGGLQVDPGALSQRELCRQAWRVIEPQYLARLSRLIDVYRTAQAQGLGTDDPEGAANAGMQGRVSTLLIEADRVLPGRIDQSTGRIHYADLDHPEVDDVLDDLGELVRIRKGEVVVVPADRMPTETGVAAVYRF